MESLSYSANQQKFWEEHKCGNLKYLENRKKMMPKSTRDDLLCHVKEISVLANLEQSARHPFDANALKWFTDFERGAIFSGMPALMDLSKQIPASINLSALDAVFGIFRECHSFRATELGWAKLTEPQITRTLVDLLGRGETQLRARRIYAFLEALGMTSLPKKDASFAGISIAAETPTNDGRIDILFKNVPTTSPKAKTAVIIEAKFGHKITKGQLKGYRDFVRKKFVVNKPECFLLALAEESKRGLKGPQHNIWNYVAWRDLWLRFEKLRPDEDYPSLEIFLNTLWGRIGALNPKDAT